MRTTLLVSVSTLIACGKAADKAPEPTPGSARPTAPPPSIADAAAPTAIDAPSPPAAPRSTLEATLLGKPVAFTSAVATSRGDEIQIFLANYPRTCEDTLSGSSARSSTPDDVESELKITPYVTTDGLGWGLHGSYTHSTEPGTSTNTTYQSEKSDGAFPLAPGIDFLAVAAAGAKTKVPLAYKSGPDDQLVVKGAIEVIGCGAAKRAPEPVPTPLGDGSITMGGKPFPIGGAGIITKKDGRREILLGSHPVTCVEGTDYLTTRSNVRLTLTFSKPGVLTHAERGGYWVDWGVNQGEKIGLTVSPNRPPAGAKTLALTLGGETVIDTLPVALAGKVVAVVCPTPK